MLRLILTIALLAAAALAQTVDEQYFVAAGAGYRPVVKDSLPTAKPTGWMVMGVRVAEGTYTYTSLSMTDQRSTLGQGMLRVLIRQDGFTLAALADAGVATGESSIGSSVTGGALLTYDLSRWTRVPKTWVAGGVKISRTSDVQPVFYFGIGKSF